jgi:hypothetical protein
MQFLGIHTKQIMRQITLCAALYCLGGFQVSMAEEGSQVFFETATQARVFQQAADVVGNSESANLALVRELQMWRRRAVEAEERLAASGLSAPKSGDQISQEPAAGAVLKETSHSGRFEVVSVMASERVLIVSSGRESGIFEGALLRLDSGVVVKVLESRRNCCAAVVENSFRGNISALEGQAGRVLLRQPAQ